VIDGLIAKADAAGSVSSSSVAAPPPTAAASTWLAPHMESNDEPMARVGVADDEPTAQVGVAQQRKRKASRDQQQLCESALNVATGAPAQDEPVDPSAAALTSDSSDIAHTLLNLCRAEASKAPAKVQDVSKMSKEERREMRAALAAMSSDEDG
jgi:hypothetical protein